MTIMPGPCVICGAVNYEPSVGGPNICQSCDCGNFGPAVVQRLGSEIVELRKRLEQAERLVRTDEALSRQLGRSIEKNARLQVAIAQGRIEIEQMMQTEPDAGPILTRVLEIMRRF